MILKKRKEIDDIFKLGIRIPGRIFNAFVHTSGKSSVAFLISKRTGNAVKRNRMKRLFREAFRINKKKFEGKEIIFYIKRFQDDFQIITQHVKNLMLL